MLADFVRQIYAKKTFKLKDEYEFVEFDDVSKETITDDIGSIPQQLDIYATIKMNYEGQLPESYKVLNLAIGDWVETNMDSLTKTIHEKLKGHFATYYETGSDYSELDGEETSIWTDQLDYYPIINPGDNTMTIEIELVINAEPLD